MNVPDNLSFGTNYKNKENSSPKHYRAAMKFEGKTTPAADKA